jgi:holo-[acyl-carrier protein] synthase
MILGLGIDIVDVGRIERLVSTYGEQFLRKVFTSGEVAYCCGMGKPALHYAGRFAVKEAFYKALPPSCQSLSTWKSIETIPSGDDNRPEVKVVDGQLVERLRGLGMQAVRVSISHERTMCVACVVLDA